jgi:ribosomal protein S12 methylthiotransferase
MKGTGGYVRRQLPPVPSTSERTTSCDYRQSFEEKNRQLIGKRLPLLVEGHSEETDLLWQGRMESQAPRIDGVVLINDVEGEMPQAGEFRTVEIAQSMEYDLMGKLVP